MNDKEMIKTAVLDYIEGWYEGDKIRMDKALDHRLVKRRIVSKEEIWDVTKEQMLDLTEKGTGKIENPKKGRKDIIILDMTDTMASVKIVSNEYDDYAHLCKYYGEWKIVNVLWDLLKK